MENELANNFSNWIQKTPKVSASVTAFFEYGRKSTVGDHIISSPSHKRTITKEILYYNTSYNCCIQWITLPRTTTTRSNSPSRIQLASWSLEAKTRKIVAGVNPWNSPGPAKRTGAKNHHPLWRLISTNFATPRWGPDTKPNTLYGNDRLRRSKRKSQPSTTRSTDGRPFRRGRQRRSGKKNSFATRAFGLFGKKSKAFYRRPNSRVWLHPIGSGV